MCPKDLKTKPITKPKGRPNLKAIAKREDQAVINEKILDTISELIWLDVSEMREKAKDKPVQKKYFVTELTRARKAYIEVVAKGNYENIEDVALTVENLLSATAAFNSHCIVSVAEALKIAKYTRTILEIEKNRRDEVVYNGLTDLDDSELWEQVQSIFDKKAKA